MREGDGGGGGIVTLVIIITPRGLVRNTGTLSSPGLELLAARRHWPGGDWLTLLAVVDSLSMKAAVRRQQVPLCLARAGAAPLTPHHSQQ